MTVETILYPPPKITTSQIEERLVRDDFTNELYMPLSSTIVLKRKKEMLYVPLDFENGLTIDALVDSGAYVSAIAQKELDRIKQQAPSNIQKINDPPNFVRTLLFLHQLQKNLVKKLPSLEFYKFQKRFQKKINFFFT